MNPKPIFITALTTSFLISFYYSLGQDTNHQDAEQLEQTAREYFAGGDFQQAVHYLELSNTEYEKLGKKDKVAANLQNIGVACLMSSDFNRAEEYLHKAEKQFIALGDKDHLAYCYNNLGLVNYYKGDYPVALDFYKKASELYKEVNKPEDYAELINRIGMTYWSLGINDKALEFLHQYGRLLNPENPKSQAISFNNLGAIYKEIGNIDKALEYYRKAVDYYQRANDSLNLPSPLTNIGTIYSLWEYSDSALLYYNRSLAISEKMNDKLQSAKTKHNIALVYNDLKRYTESRGLLNEFLEMSRELGYREGITQAELSLGNLARIQHQYGLAEQLYRDCIRDAADISKSDVLMQAYKFLSEILEEQHYYHEALYNFQRYMAVKDTIFNKEKTRTITELETRYETDKKEQENILLLKDNELKDITINTLFFILTGIIIIAVSLLFLIILYRRNAMTKKRLSDSEASRLKEKVEFQSRELASSALALSRNLNFIQSLLTELKQLTPHVDHDGLNTVKSISRNIQHLDNNQAWAEFELRFRQVHQKFYEVLLGNYPSLTTNEVRLCALLKLGMNTKEISSVTFQNIRAIEAARLRLRKKFGLEGTEDLCVFLQKI